VTTAFSLADLEKDYYAAPTRARQTLEAWKGQDYGEFLAASAKYLRDAADSSFTRVLLCLLREDGASLEEVLLRQDVMEAEQGRLLLRILAKLDPAYPLELLSQLRKGKFDASAAGRFIDLLSPVVDAGAMLPVLLELNQHEDPVLRSRAVFWHCRLARQMHHGLAMSRDQIARDADPRVRANAIEALWGEADEEAVGIFREALADQHHRVVANGLYGLYRAGDLLSLRKIPQLLRHEELSFQLAALWVIAKTGDVRFMPLLENLLANATGRFRAGLLRTARAIEAKRQARQQLEDWGLVALETEWGAAGRFRGMFALSAGLGKEGRGNEGRGNEGRIPESRTAEARQKIAGLRATSLLLHDGGMRVDSFRFEPYLPREPLWVAVIWEQRVGAADPAAVAAQAALEAAIREKRGQDWWGWFPFHSSVATGSVATGSAAAGFSSTGGTACGEGAYLSSSSQLSQALHARARAATAPQALKAALASMPADAKERHVVLVGRESKALEVPECARAKVHRLGGIAELPSRMAVLPAHFTCTYALHRVGKEEKPLPVKLEMFTETGKGEIEMEPPPQFAIPRSLAEGI
jgi:hypothetical protein